MITHSHHPARDGNNDTGFRCKSIHKLNINFHSLFKPISPFATTSTGVSKCLVPAVNAIVVRISCTNQHPARSCHQNARTTTTPNSCTSRCEKGTTESSEQNDIHIHKIIFHKKVLINKTVMYLKCVATDSSFSPL